MATWVQLLFGSIAWFQPRLDVPVTDLVVQTLDLSELVSL